MVWGREDELEISRSDRSICVMWGKTAKTAEILSKICIKIRNLTTPVLDIDLDARGLLRVLLFCRSKSTDANIVTLPSTNAASYSYQRIKVAAFSMWTLWHWCRKLLIKDSLSGLKSSSAAPVGWRIRAPQSECCKALTAAHRVPLLAIGILVLFLIFALSPLRVHIFLSVLDDQVNVPER